MKRMILSLVAAIIGTTAVCAQSSQLATLSHNGNISTYYGMSALRDAYGDAQDGDVITLSSGSFNSVTIEKALTIRGAGMKIDTISKTYPTVISGDFSIGIPATSTGKLLLEGLYHNGQININTELNNAIFQKCRFSYFGQYYDDGLMHNLTFVHCVIASHIQLLSNSSATFMNCYVSNPYCNSETTSNYGFINCIVFHGNVKGGNFWDEKSAGIFSSTFKNCIVFLNPQYTTDNGENAIKLANSNTAYYCIGESFRDGSSKDPFGYLDNKQTDKKVVGLLQIFKTYTGKYTDEETFELTEEAKAKYLGEDGTQVGMYGGNMPFDPTTSTPQITKCQVAAKSTADGKLSVDIEVKAGY